MYSVGGSDKIVPIDAVYMILASQPPQATIYGFAMALGLLDQKLKERNHEESGAAAPAPLLPDALPDIRVRIERYARALLVATARAGKSATGSSSALRPGSTAALEANLQKWIRDAEDSV